MPDMNEEQLNPDETPKEREDRLRAEIDKLTEGKSLKEITSMVVNALTFSDLQANEAWLKNMGPGMRAIGDIDTRPFGAPPPSQRADSLVPRLNELRDEAQALFPEVTREYGVLWTLLGKYRQAIGNVILWYGQWEKNRDYSSAINASMALGKLSSLNALMPREEVGSPNTTDCDKVAKALDKLCGECWDRIQAAAGRIVPFEQG